MNCQRHAFVTTTKVNGAVLTTPHSATYTYNLDGMIASTTLPTGDATAYTYDGYGRLGSVISRKPDGKVVSSTLMRWPRRAPARG